MKKIILGLCIVTTGLILIIVQSSYKENETANGVEKIFSEDYHTFDYAQNKFTVHAMGVSPEEKVMTVKIEKQQYKEKAEEYFRNLLDSNAMENFELEVFVEDLSSYEK